MKILTQSVVCAALMFINLKRQFQMVAGFYERLQTGLLHTVKDPETPDTK